jgi:hypothetical protein
MLTKVMKQAARCAAGLTAIAMLTHPTLPARSDTFTCGSQFTQWSHIVTLAGTQTTSSMTAVDLPGATFSFTPGDRCLIVEVTGQVRAVRPNAMRLSVVVTGGDGISPPFPSPRDVYTQTTAYDTRTVTFWVDLLEGDKDVKVQFMSVNGTPVSLNKGVVIFKHTPVL